MAQLVLATAGAWLGSVAFPSGILGVSGGAFGWFVGSTLGSAFGPKQKSFGPRIDDLKVAGTGYGQPVPWVAGSPRVGGTIIWSSEKRETATTTEVGKGGGSEYTEYTYDCDVLYMLSENEISNVSRIWSNGKLVYDGAKIKSGFCDSITVYTGASDQLPDPIYEAAVGSGNAPAYRTRGTIMIAGLKLGSSGFLPNLTFELSVGNPSPIGGDVFWLINASGPVNSTSATDESIYSNTVSVWDMKQIAGGGYQGFIYVNTSGISPTYVLSDGMSIPWTQNQHLAMEARIMIESGANIVILRSLWIADVTNTPYIHCGIQPSTTPGNSALYLTVFGETVYGPEHPSANLDDIIGYGVKHWEVNYNGDTKTATLFINGVATLAKTYAGSPLSFTSIYNARVVSTASASSMGVEKIGFDGARYATNQTPKSSNFTPSNEAPTNDERLVIGGFPINNTKSISDVVDELMVRAGYELDEYDASDLVTSSEIQAKAIYLSQVAPTRSAIEILQSAYYFTVSKSDKIYFKFRDISTSGTFNYDDLGVSDSPEGIDNPFPIKNTNVLEQPSQISLTYNNMSFDFNQDVASSDILVTDQKSTNAMQIPLGMLPSEAKGVVESMLLDQVAARVQYGPFRLPLSYAQYEPSDVVIITDTTGSEHRVRLTKKTDMGIMLEFEGVGDDEGALIAAGIADDTDQGQTVVEQPSGSIWLPGDWPLFRDADDVPGYLALAKSEGDGDFWPGAGFFRSWDDVTFSQVGSFAASSIFGKCSTVLPNFNGGNVWDESSVLRVDVGQGELSSSTKSAMQADLSINIAMVGAECIRFRLATLISPGVYDLSGLIRGFRGTEWAIGTHGADEDFALVNFNTNWINVNTNQIGLNQFVKAVTFNTPLSSEDATQFNYTGVNLKPFSVSNPRALYTEDGLLISWNRRTRRSYSYGGVAGVVAPLGEAFERYRLYFYDGSTLIRTEVVNDAQEFLYTEEMAQEDGLSSNASVTIEIVQVSEIVGDGYPSYVEGMMQ